MKRYLIILLVFIGVISFFLYRYFNRNLKSALTAIKKPSVDISDVISDVPGENNTNFEINVPDNFSFSIFRGDFEKPRVLAGDPQNNLIISDIGDNNVYLLDEQKNKKLLASNFDKPHGLEMYCQNSSCHLYIADKLRVYRYDYDTNSQEISNKQVIANIPQTGRHTTKDLLIHNNKLFISIGSSCDVCLEDDLKLATVMWANLDGSELEVYSSGLRNAVFLENRPNTDQVWVTEMGRDFLGDDLPPDELNILQKGGFYGWPYCYGKNVLDTTFSTSNTANQACRNAIPSHYDLQAHSAPLGLEFLDKNTLLVSYHGSWNRSKPTGYKIVKLKLDEEGRVAAQEDFLTGWLNENNQAIGRPVDILKLGEDIFITDDKAGVVYKLSPV